MVSLNAICVYSLLIEVYLNNKEMKTKSEFLSEAMVKLLNYRVEQEEFSARIYLAMSTWLDDKGFVGAAKLFKQYSDL